MKKTLLAIATYIIAFGANAQQKSLQIGDDMPKIKTEMVDAGSGNELPYYKAAGKNGLLVMFSCNTCPYVVKNESLTLKTIEYAKAHGVGMVIINSNEAKRGDDDSYDAMKAYAANKGYQVPYLVDVNSQLADAFGANRTPEVFLFDTKNKLVYKGGLSDNPAPAEAKVIYINDAIDAMVAGKKIDPNTTKSIGCSIKRKAS